MTDKHEGDDPRTSAGDPDRRLEHVLAMSPAITYTTVVRDGQLAPTWVSANIERIMGWTAEEALDPEWWTRGLHPDDREAALRASARFQTTGEGVHVYRFRRKDGGWAWIEDRVRTLRREGDMPVELVGAWTDVSDRSALETAYLQAQKMETVGRFASVVAQDFANVLHIISGNLSLLRARMALDPRTEELQEVERALAEGSRIARQLVGLGASAGEHPGEVDLRDAVRGVNGLLRRLCGEGVQLRVDLPEQPVRVRADLARLEHAVLELVSNARDAMPGGGTLRVEVGIASEDDPESWGVVVGRPPAPPCARIVVTDTGEGMDAVTLSRAFEPFFTTRSSVRGIGLGLATVTQLAEGLRGCVRARSAPAGGTTVEIWLPLAE